MKQNFSQIEKLKSKKEIESLFAEGSSISQFPIRLIYKKTQFDDPVLVKAAVSVSKRNFKNAVHRNRIKRLLREGYRKNKYIVIDNNTKTINGISFVDIMSLQLSTSEQYTQASPFKKGVIEYVMDLELITRKEETHYLAIFIDNEKEKEGSALFLQDLEALVGLQREL